MFEIKDSGARQEFEGGGVRDTEEGKLDYSNLFVWFEPMGSRYAAHMTKGRSKYGDMLKDGRYVPNWSLFPATPEVLARTERSLDRHYKAYRMGMTDEDHAAAILFNLNLCERIKAELDRALTFEEAVTAALFEIAERSVPYDTTPDEYDEPEPELCGCGDTMDHPISYGEFHEEPDFERVNLEDQAEVVEFDPNCPECRRLAELTEPLYYSNDFVLDEDDDEINGVVF